MRFVDYARISVRSGNGGKGCVSFRREKYVPRGGPDGGDGGRGGNVILRATMQLQTLLDFRYKREYRSQKGQDGMGKNMHGKNGTDLFIPVPVGTVVKSCEQDVILADLKEEGDLFVAARGGKGGLGNAHFATPTRQVPKFAQPGQEGEERWLILELKLIADVGLVGLPNAGKSTLISVISAARPKIADYPFTTTVPNLGVVRVEEHRSFVVADIPGLIEGAHAGAGLGIQFLRHIERTKIFLHLIDISDTAQGDPVEHYHMIKKELGMYREELLAKHQAVVATKLDIASDTRKLDILEEYCKTNHIELIKISSVTGEGIKELIYYLARHLEKI